MRQSSHSICTAPSNSKTASAALRSRPRISALFNPNTRTAPTFRTRRDAVIARKLYARAGVLWRDARDSGTERNPWGIRFQSMFHMTNDSELLRTREELTADGWRLEGNVFTRGEERLFPLYEAKLFHPVRSPLRHVRRCSRARSAERQRARVDRRG